MYIYILIYFVVFIYLTKCTAEQVNHVHMLMHMLMKHNNLLENVQIHAMKLVNCISKLVYTESLRNQI